MLLTGIDMLVLIFFLVACGVTVGLVVMTLKGDGRKSQVRQTASLGGGEQGEELPVDLCEPIVFEPIGKHDRHQTEGQYQ